MGGTIRTPIPIRSGRLVIEGVGWAGEDIRLVVEDARFTQPDELVEVREVEHDVMWGADKPYVFTEYSEVTIEMTLKPMTSDDNGQLYRIERPVKTENNEPGEASTR